MPNYIFALESPVNGDARNDTNNNGQQKLATCYLRLTSPLEQSQKNTDTIISDLQSCHDLRDMENTAETSRDIVSIGSISPGSPNVVSLEDSRKGKGFLRGFLLTR